MQLGVISGTDTAIRVELWGDQIESLYEIDPLRGKVKRQGRWVGKRNDWKKAIVTLGADQKIDLFEQI